MKKNIKKFFQQLKKHFSPGKRALILIWLIAIPVSTIIFDAPARTIEFSIIDTWERIACRFRTSAKQLVIIGIDSEALSLIKDRWPWQRHHLAHLLQKIDKGNPRFIVLDILLQHLQSDFAGKGDQVLSETFDELGNIVLVSLIENKYLPSGIKKMLVQNHQLFRQKGLFQGLVGSLVDSDGISRSFVLKDHDFGLKSAALWIAENYQQKNLVQLKNQKNIATYLLAHANKNGEIPLVSASAIFTDKFPLDYFKDKIVIIGGTAPILHDFHNTSRGRMTGPRLLGIAIDTLLNERGAEILQGFGWNLLMVLLAFALGWMLTFFFDQAVFKTILVVSIFFIAVSVALHELARVFIPSGSFIVAFLLTSGTLLIVKRFMNTIETTILEAEALSAGKVQQELFPASPMKAKQHLISGICIPCTSAGGDFFEMFEHSSGKSFFAIADVMGHGIPAALITSMIKTVLTTHRQKDELSLQTILCDLNQVLCSTFSRKKMVSGIFGLFDPENFHCELAIAGHPAAYYFRRDQTIEEIGGASAPIGILKKPRINFVSLKMLAGEKLLFYTDGIVEAQNSAGEQYGYKRWEENLKAQILGSNKLPELSDLLVDMRLYTAGIQVDDDLTILLLSLENKSCRESEKVIGETK